MHPSRTFQRIIKCICRIHYFSFYIDWQDCSFPFFLNLALYLPYNHKVLGSLSMEIGLNLKCREWALQTLFYHWMTGLQFQINPHFLHCMKWKSLLSWWYITVVFFSIIYSLASFHILLYPSKRASEGWEWRSINTKDSFHWHICIR